MRKIAIIFCFIPWIVMGFGFMFLPTEYMIFNRVGAVGGMLSAILSPALIGIGMLIAFKEGQLSIKE